MPPEPQQQQKLTYLSSVEIPRGKSVPLAASQNSLEISELSGITFSPKSGAPGEGVLRAIGDKTKVAERNPVDGASAKAPQNAIFDFKLRLSQGKLDLEPLSATAVDVQKYREQQSEFAKGVTPGKFVPDFAWDTEDLVQLADGRMLVTLEGFDEKHKPGMAKFPRVGSGIAVVEPDGTISSMLPLPAELRPQETANPDGTTKLVAGQRANLGLEAAGLTEDGKTLMVGMESAIVQDGELSNFERGGIARIMRYENQGERGFALAAEFVPISIPAVAFHRGEARGMYVGL